MGELVEVAMQTVPSGSSTEPGVWTSTRRQLGRMDADDRKYKLDVRLCVTTSALETTGIVGLWEKHGAAHVRALFSDRPRASLAEAAGL